MVRMGIGMTCSKSWRKRGDRESSLNAPVQLKAMEAEDLKIIDNSYQ